MNGASSTYKDSEDESEANISNNGPPFRIQSEQICCLSEDGERCDRSAGNASYSKRIQKTVQQRKLRLHLDSNARHIYICDYHKNQILTARVRPKRRPSTTDDEMENDQNGNGSGSPEERANPPLPGGVDLIQLQINTLRRYKRHFKVQTKPGLNKSQLAETLQRHFSTIPVVEKDALTYFVYMVKTRRSKMDQKPAANDSSSEVR
ncbi:histone deacetylase complex subunit SAP30L-like [Artemia franciscana]|uniref:Uncharacterized protein n=1 Tax=Artemia franciscana TaxID=6661 RepID=A0AA88I6P3_ARTSF|nr:hypothetical protein QYM36_010758 [Artemia franciscana]KAK2716282.1 hypothetical protein QYM36_010758 [Artemia franciscana]KAK2716283.1 hypothetical protein QYM36_010758 [Artemia franciscana]